MTDVDLLGDPLPEPLPDGARLTDADELVRHTILAVFESPCGRYESDMVIVTATRCWIVFRAEVEGCSAESGTYIDVKRTTNYRGETETLHDYVSAAELLRANVIQPAEHARLTALEDQRNAEVKDRRAAQLRQELAELESRKA